MGVHTSIITINDSPSDKHPWAFALKMICTHHHDSSLCSWQHTVSNFPSSTCPYPTLQADRSAANIVLCGGSYREVRVAQTVNKATHQQDKVPHFQHIVARRLETLDSLMTLTVYAKSRYPAATGWSQHHASDLGGRRGHSRSTTSPEPLLTRTD